MSVLLQWIAYGVMLWIVYKLFMVVSAPATEQHKNGRRFPPSPGPGWPLLGHLPLLARTSHPHRHFIEISKKLGPIFSIRMGCQPTVIVSSAELAKEVLQTHDKVLASRPDNLQLTKTLLYGPENEIVFAKYGDGWHKLRKTLIHHLFTANKLAHTRHVRQEEVRSLVQRIAACPPGTPVDIGREGGKTIADVINRLVQSKRFDDGDANGLFGIIHEIDTAAKPSVGDLIPLLRWTDSFVCKPQMLRLHKRLDGVFDGIMEERRQLKSSSDYKKHDDLVEVLLDMTSQGILSPNQMKGILTDIFLAGISTTMAVIEWAFAELICNKDCLATLRNEINSIVGRGNEVLETHIVKLHYLQWTIKEVLRLHPVLPLLVPRISMDDCNISSYFIPKGTQVMVNVFSVGRDPSLWDNPEYFNPSRFKDVDVDVKGFHHELLPFGSGRRICPGMPLAFSSVHLVIANLVAKFDWTTSNVDMIEDNGMLHKKQNPTVVIPKIYLPI